MTLDELADSFEERFSDPSLQRLAELLRAWRLSAETVVTLRYQVEKFLGNVWLSDSVHVDAYSLWSLFIEKEVNQIQGMTMNERLWAFGLMERFDAAGPAEQEVIYSKVLAKR